jgi:hypothetical protein
MKLLKEEEKTISNEGELKRRFINLGTKEKYIYWILDDAKNDLLSRLPSSKGSLEKQMEKALEYCPIEFVDWFVKWFGKESLKAEKAKP